MEQKDIFTVYEGEGGRGGVRGFTARHQPLFIREASQTLVFTLWHTVTLNMEDRPGIVNDAVFFIKQHPPGYGPQG